VCSDAFQSTVLRLISAAKDSTTCEAGEDAEALFSFEIGVVLVNSE